ncbi:hypothetical protein D3C81_2195970 [compost metagenome]
MHLVDQTRVDTGFPQYNCRTVGGVQLETKLQQLRRQVNDALFIAFTHGEQCAALFLHGGAAAQLRLGECFRKGAAYAHHFAGRAHFWP